MVFGHGRNFEPDQAQRNQLWDGFNQSFNQQVALALKAGGRRAVALVLPVGAIDLQLTEDERQQRCAQALEPPGAISARHCGLASPRFRASQAQPLQ